MNAANKLLGVQLINVLGLIGNRHCHTIIPDINIHPHVSQGTRSTVFLCVHVFVFPSGTRPIVFLRYTLQCFLRYIRFTARVSV